MKMGGGLMVVCRNPHVVEVMREGKGGGRGGEGEGSGSKRGRGNEM